MLKHLRSAGYSSPISITLFIYSFNKHVLMSVFQQMCWLLGIYALRCSV